MAKRILLLLCMAASLTTFAQRGAISGTVYDEKGETLPGANVVIEGTTTGAQTDFIEGKYQFQVEPGVYTIVASFVGYGDRKIEGVEVQANETTILDIVFDPDAAGGVNLDEVVVTAKALERGTVAVLKLRQNDVNAKDIISQQEISSLGIGNVSGAMAKVTGTTIVDGKYVYVRGLGDRYSATTINGLRLPSIDPYRNSAQLDLIPTSILDNISASKTFTPDLPGDFTGGSVDVKIKALPERFTWGISVGTSYNTQSNLQDNFLTYEGNDLNNFGYPEESLSLPVDLDDERLNDLGVFSRSAARNARTNDELAAELENVADAFGQGYSINEDKSPLNYSLSANVGNQFKLGSMPLGVFGTVSLSKDYFHYNGGTTGRYLTAGLGATSLQEIFDLRRDLSREQSDVGGMVGLNLRLNPSNNLSFYTLYSHQGAASVVISQGSYEAKGASGEPNNNFEGRESSFLERELTDYVLQGEHTLRSLNNAKIEWTGNFVSSSQNEPDYRYLEYIRQTNSFLNDQSQFSQPSRFFRDLTDETYEAKLDITIPVATASDRGNSIKFGGQYRSKDRDFNENVLEYFQRAGGGLTFSQAGGDPDVYFGDANTGLIGEEGGINEIGAFLINTSRESNSYVGSDNVAAGYLMGTAELTEFLKVTAGLRVENTQIDIESDRAALVDPVNRELEIADIDGTNFMPAVNLVYKVMPNHNLRASYSQTVARPNMREVAPFASFNGVDADVVGNVNLELSTINNFDLRYEIFPEQTPGELYSFSAFYKNFKNPIVVTYLPGGGGRQQFTWANTEAAKLYGIEFELRKTLDFLGQSFQGFTFSNNLALITSDQDITDEECESGRGLNENYDCERPFNGQSNFVINANLAYQTKTDDPWDAIVAFNYFSDRLQSIGSPGTPDIYEQGRAQLDLSVSKSVNNLKISLRARNLLDPDYRTFSEFQGEEYDFGRYQRGRVFSLSLSYGI